MTRPDDRLTKGLLQLHARGDMTEAQRDVLLDSANALAWDDALHIAAPWEPRSSLCGHWNRNLVVLGEAMPPGLSPCWTCMIAKQWFEDAGLFAAVPHV
jgi:hypothetical protein